MSANHPSKARREEALSNTIAATTVYTIGLGTIGFLIGGPVGASTGALFGANRGFTKSMEENERNQRNSS